MPSNQKRIEALSEMFLSEKSYIDDLSLWEKGFRKKILSFPFMSLKIKYEICDMIFLNIGDMLKVHTEIFYDMVEKNIEVKKLMDPNYVHDPKDMSFILDKADYDNPNILTLEYASVIFKYAPKIHIYEDYVSRLPKAEFELEKITRYSPDFKKGLNEWLEENNIEFLGTKHFLYRPTQKIARFALLLNAIDKNEENPNYKKLYRDLIGVIKILTTKVDNSFNKYITQFKIYRLSQTLKYRDKVDNQLCLGLFQKKRRLLKEGNILVKNDFLFDPCVIKIYIFDIFILFCDIPQGDFHENYILDDPVFMSKIILFKKDIGFYPPNPQLDSFFPIFILETSHHKVKALYFEDVDLRDLHYKIIKKAIKKVKRRFHTNIEIKKMDLEFDSGIISACKSTKELLHTLEIESESDSCGEEENSNSSSISEESSVSSSISQDEENDVHQLNQNVEVKRAVSEYANILERRGQNTMMRFQSHLNPLRISMNNGNNEDEESEQTSNQTNEEGDNWFKRFCFGGEIFSRVINYELDEDRSHDIEFLRKQDEMMIIAAKDGIYKVVDGVRTKIFENSVKKVLYDCKYEILIFQSCSTLYIAKFNCMIDSIECIPIKNEIGDFFYGTTKKGSFIASRNYGSGKSSLIFLFQIERSDNVVSIDLSRKLYVGFKVYNIVFCQENIVIACKDFEVVDMDTLRTEELLESYDPFIPFLLNSIPKSRAKGVFPITKKSFLLCFDSVGFIVDNIGRIMKTNRIFLWNCKPLEFKLFYNYVICLGKKSVDIYDIKTGELVFTTIQEGLRFVSGSFEPIFYDKNNFFKINI